MSNYKNDEYFYYNNTNIKNKIIDDKLVEMWAKPYIDFFLIQMTWKNKHQRIQFHKCKKFPP